MKVGMLLILYPIVDPKIYDSCHFSASDRWICSGEYDKRENDLGPESASQGISWDTSYENIFMNNVGI